MIHHGIKGQKWGERNGPPYPLRKSKTKPRLSEYDIEDKETGEHFYLSDDTKIRDPQVFAGKGCKHKLDDNVTAGLSEQIGGKPEEWQHCKGNATIDYYGEDRDAEIHWFQEPSVGKCKFKIKKWLDD